MAKLKFLIVLLPNCGAMEHTTGGECKLLKPFGEKCDVNKVEEVRTFYSSIPLLDICPTKACTGVMFGTVHCSIVKICKQPKQQLTF